MDEADVLYVERDQLGEFLKENESGPSKPVVITDTNIPFIVPDALEIEKSVARLAQKLDDWYHAGVIDVQDVSILVLGYT
jgi:hypothetical protein